MWLLFPFIACCCRLATARTYRTDFDSTWDDDQWTLTTNRLVQGEYQSRMSLANGYLGINVAALGPFFEVDSSDDMINEWPLFDRRQTFATIAGFYDYQPTTNGSNFPWLSQYGGESVISGIPHWAGLHVQIGDAILSADVNRSQIFDFNSTLDVRQGLMHWQYVWMPEENVCIDVSYTMFVHKLHVNRAAVQLNLTSHTDLNVIVIDVLQGDAAVRTNNAGTHFDTRHPVIGSAVRPWGIENVTAHVFSTFVGDDSCDEYSRRQVTDKTVIGGNGSSIGQSFEVSLKAGITTSLHKFVGAASTDAFPHPETVAWRTSRSGGIWGWHGWLSSHVDEWATILTSNTVDNFRLSEDDRLPDDPNIQQLQITSITNTFYILQNTVGQNAIFAAANNTKLDINSIPVCGLGDSCYGGAIFWDSEVWMAPGLVVTSPQSMKQIAKYRVDKLAQAQQNVKTAYQSSQVGRNFSTKAAIFPWISSRFGNCTAVGPCWDYEYHINGDIGLELYNYLVVSGDSEFFRNELFPIFDAVAYLYADLVEWNTSTSSYHLRNATDPDEFANAKDDVAFTKAFIATHLNTTNALRHRFDMDINVAWTNISRQLALPVDENASIILEYAGMNATISVKQADVVLVDDFLDYPNQYSLNDLDYYAGKQSQSGPAMTYGVFSIVANSFSPSGCSSYTYDLYGSRPYLRAPWLQYSEQLVDDPAITGFHPAFPFLTGMGGALRVSVFGYLGLHLRLESLHVDPSLPPQITQIRYRTIYWQGWPVQIFSNQSHTVLSRGGTTTLSTSNVTFANTSLPLTVGKDNTLYQLPINGNVTIPNRRIGENKTIAGNLNQCRPTLSSAAYVNGQFPIGAVDGASSTRWQPSFLNKTANITVDLGNTFVPIRGIYFDWAQSVPETFVVSFHNSTDGSDAVEIVRSDEVVISKPFDPNSTAEIVPYQGNTTKIDLGSLVWSGRFATLSISGNQALKGTSDETNGTGASVAEFVLVADL